MKKPKPYWVIWVHDYTTTPIRGYRWWWLACFATWLYSRGGPYTTFRRYGYYDTQDRSNLA